MNIRNRVLLITGGTSGIGYALVKKLASITKAIIVIARDAEKLNQLNNTHPHIYTYSCDIANKVDLESVLNHITEQHPDISIVINNAGIQNTPTFLDEDFNPNSIDYEIATNLVAPIQICAHMIGLLAKRSTNSAIINVTSGLGFYPKKNAAVYCATKAGLRNFTQSLRYQLENTSINVIDAILPLVDTPMTQGRGKGKISTETAAIEIISGIEKEKDEIYVGKTRWIPLLSRLSPSLTASILKAG